MIFLDTKRFSPVVHLGDLPREGDLFHFRSIDIPKTKKEKKEFILDNNIFIDKEWWYKQFMRCIHGFYIDNAIAPGGDAIVDGEDAIWDDEGDCFITQYDLLIKNRRLFISGRYYWYLNFWPIYGVPKGGIVKQLMKPLFTDMDFLFSQRIEMMYKLGKDDQELKARQRGFSEKVAGMLAGYNYTFVDSSVNVIVGGTQGDADHTMENTVRGLDDLINTQFYLDRKRGGDRSDYIESLKTQSKVMALTAKDNAQTVSRFSPSLVIFEEVGKGKKEWSLETAEFVKPSIVAQNGIKTGYLIFIGTGGEMSDGVYDLEQRTYNPDDYNILSFKNKWTELSTEYGDRVGHFTPSWWMKVMDDNGNTKKKESLDLIEEEYKKTASEKKYRFKTQNPTYIENVFLTSDAGYFGRDIIMRLNNRYSLLASNKHMQIEKQYVLEFKNNKNPFLGVNFIPKKEGWLNIIEEPCKDANGDIYQNLYFSGTDSYDQDQAETSSSKGSMYIKKGFLPNHAIVNNWVAEIIERPSVADGGAKTFYLHTAMACIAYNCQNNIEYSNLRIFDFYENNGFTALLKARPVLAFAGKIQNTKVSNRYGTDKSLKPHILAILRESLTEDVIDNMFFTRQIRALSKFMYDPSGKKYNCDITIATAECEINRKESEHLVAKSRSDKPKERVKAYEKGSDGVIKIIYK